MKKITSAVGLALSVGWGNAQAAETVDVMVLYSPATGTAIQERHIVHGIVNVNTIFRNSGIDTRLRLVHADSVNFQETNFSNSKVVLSAMESKTDGVLDEIHPLRDVHGADLVILVVDAKGTWDGWSGGDANVLYHNDPGLSEYAPFALVDWRYLDGTGFAHEIGHTMGAHHDWYNSASKKVPYPHARGYVNTKAKWRTIMAYENECEDLGISCPRIPFFSNPNISYNGSPTGIPVGSNIDCQNGQTGTPPCDANAALAIMQTSPTVAGFRQEVVPELSAPKSLAPAKGTTLQTYTPEFSWADNSLVTSYRLMVGLSPEGTRMSLRGGRNQVLVYEFYNAADICAHGVCKVTPEMHNSDGRHYWSVWAGNDNGLSVWTDPVDFTLISETMKGAVNVTPLSPSNARVGKRPTFVWNATIGGPGIPDATDYRILVWDRSKNETTYSTDWMPADSVCGTDSKCRATPPIDLAAGKYLWRIRARGLYGTGEYNTRLYFEVR